MDQHSGGRPANVEEPVKLAEANDLADQSRSEKGSNRAIFFQGCAVAFICFLLTAINLDGGVLARTAGFTFLVYMVSTALILLRAGSRRLSLVDRLAVRLGFPVYLFIMVLAFDFKITLLARGLVTWPGIL